MKTSMKMSLVGLGGFMLLSTAVHAGYGYHDRDDRGKYPDFVSFIAAQAQKKDGDFNVIGNVVLALVQAGKLSGADVDALKTAQLTAFLPTDRAFRQLVADLSAKRLWQVREDEVIPFLVSALPLDTIAAVVKYHIFPSGKVDYRTALSLDTNRGLGTAVYITMYNGGTLGVDRRWYFLQLVDSGTALGIANRPWVVRADIDAGNAIVHGISAVLLP